MNENDTLTQKLDRLTQDNLRLKARLDAITTLLSYPVTFKPVNTEEEYALVNSDITTKQTLQHIEPKEGWSRWIKIEKLIFQDPIDQSPHILTIESDVSDLKERERLLKNITKNLDDFASLTSHDLQAPLRHIGIFSEMLEGEYSHSLDDTGRFYLKEIRAGVENMRVQLEGFLRFTQSAPSGIELGAINFLDIFHHAHRDLSDTLNDIDAKLTYPTAPIWVQGDAAMLTQAIRILLDNCIKYRNPDRALEIKITHKVHAELIEILVADNGMGINSDDQDSIFDLFNRSRALPETKALSVGLALCKRIMVFHGGSIKLTPRKKGACFSLNLKIAIPHS